MQLLIAVINNLLTGLKLLETSHIMPGETIQAITACNLKKEKLPDGSFFVLV
ncbi:MAG: hypothetical protein ABIP10_20935 [Ferruginibacter sp.]